MRLSNAMRKRREQDDGYVLGWVVIMVMALTIMVTGVMAAASAYYRQSLREYNERQAYLTARSVLETAAADFTGKEPGKLEGAIMDEGYKVLEGGDKATVSEAEAYLKIKVQLDSSMGTCTLNCRYLQEEECLIMTATAKKGDSTEAMTAYLKRENKEAESRWTVLRYESGDYFEILPEG